MVHVSEDEPAALATHGLAVPAIKAALVAAACDESRVFPVVLGRSCDPTDTFSVKSGFTADLTGPEGAASGAAILRRACRAADIVVTAAERMPPAIKASLNGGFTRH